MFEMLRNDEHLPRLLWQFAIVVGVAVAVLVLVGLAQWLIFGRPSDQVDSAAFKPSGAKIKNLTVEEKLQLLDLLSHGTTTVQTGETGTVAIAPAAAPQSEAQKEEILKELNKSSDSTGAQNSLTREEKLKMLSQLQ